MLFHSAVLCDQSMLVVDKSTSTAKLSRSLALFERLTCEKNGVFSPIFDYCGTAAQQPMGAVAFMQCVQLYGKYARNNGEIRSGTFRACSEIAVNCGRVHCAIVEYLDAAIVCKLRGLVSCVCDVTTGSQQSLLHTSSSTSNSLALSLQLQLCNVGSTAPCLLVPV
jgi:hypothetical protein